MSQDQVDPPDAPALSGGRSPFSRHPESDSGAATGMTGAGGAMPPGPVTAGRRRPADRERPRYLDSLDPTDIVDHITADGVLSPPEDFDG